MPKSDKKQKSNNIQSFHVHIKRKRELEQKLKDEFEKERELQSRLHEIIVTSVNPEELKNKIVKEIAISLNAERCFFVEYDLAANIFKEVTNAYNRKRETKSILGYDVEKTVPHLSRKLKFIKNLVIEDTDLFIKENNLKGSNEEVYFKEYEIKTSISVRVEFGEIFLGLLIVHYREQPQIDFLLKTLKNVAGCLGIALHLNNIYFSEKIEKDKEKLFRSIIAIMSQDHNLAKITRKIFEILGKIYEVESVLININLKTFENFYFYNLSKNNHTTEIKEKNIDEKIIDFYSQPEFSQIKSRDFYIPYVHNFIVQNNLENSKIENYLNENSIKSLILFPIIYEKIELGLIAIHFNKKNPISKSELDFIKTITEQLAIAVKQAYDFEREKRNAEKENLLRMIFEVMRNSLDIKIIKKTIVTEIGKNLDADICVIATYDETEDHFIVDKYSEYTSSEVKESFAGFDTKNFNMSWFREALKSKREVGYEKVEEFITENNLSGTDEEAFLIKHNIKSSYSLPIYYENHAGSIILHFVKEYKKIEEEELDFLRFVATQAGVALHQAFLYQKTRKQAERERILRKIIESARSSLDLAKVKEKIAQELGSAFNADRCYFRTYDLTKNIFLAPDTEYLSSDGIKSLKELEPDHEGLKYFALEAKKQEHGFSPIEVDLESSKNTPLHRYLLNAQIKIDYAIPIINRREEIIWLVLHYCKEHSKLSDEDKKLLETIAYQIDIAIEQIKLYNEAKKNAEREALVRNITEKIRSSLEIEETLQFICESTAKLFNVQRATIVNFYDSDNYEKYIVKKEYKINEDVVGLESVNYKTSAAAYWAHNLLTKGGIVSYDNIPESDVPDSFKETYRILGVKSMIGAGIKKGETKWGTLVLSEYNSFRHWTDEEKDLLETIANQIYIAINQAELYQKEKIALEREKISRDIIEILRSSIDKNIIKKLFVRNIGKFFNADRVYLSEFDNNQRVFLPVELDSEYLSSPKEKSIINMDISNSDIVDNIILLLEKREIKISSIDEYLKQNTNKSENFINFYKNANVKSSYSFPILYQYELLGFVCIDFTTSENVLTEEDINRIRNICTQAGIALYHAELYSRAQDCKFSKESFIKKVSEKIEEPTNKIIDISKLLSENELERNVQIDYLNNIINSCNELLELTQQFH